MTEGLTNTSPEQEKIKLAKTKVKERLDNLLKGNSAAFTESKLEAFFEINFSQGLKEELEKHNVAVEPIDRGYKLTRKETINLTFTNEYNVVHKRAISLLPLLKKLYPEGVFKDSDFKRNPEVDNFIMIHFKTGGESKGTLLSYLIKKGYIKIISTSRIKKKLSGGSGAINRIERDLKIV